MMTVRAASSATLSVASVPRRAAALREVVHREGAAQEAALREAVLQEVRLRETQAVAAVVPHVMTTMITTHRAAVVVVGDSFLVTKPTKLSKPCFLICWEGNGSQPLAVATPTNVGN